MKISVKDSTIVLPATETPQHGLWISNLDYVMARAHAATVYFYRPNGSNNFFDVRLMKESLGRALVPFYPAAGRLRLGEDKRLEINCNGHGVLFVEASAEGMMDDFGDFSPTEEMKQLIPQVDYSDDISSYPLVILQVTMFKCGGVCLGTGIHHTLADGFAGLHFVNSWSDLTRGMDATCPPIIDRTFLRARDPPRPTSEHTEYQPPPTLKSKQLSEEPQVTSTVGATFKFSKDQLAKLKDKANQANSSSTRYSTFECLAAHVWRCVSLARGLDDDQKTKLHITMDGRPRLRPEIPKNYFGNVVIQATLVEVVGDLLSWPLHYVVDKIHNAVLRVDDEYLRSALDYLELQPNLNELVRGVKTYGSPNLKMTSWVRFPLYAADFGWGRPIFVGAAKRNIDGSGVVLPATANDGSLSVSIGLQPDALGALDKLVYDI